MATMQELEERIKTLEADAEKRKSRQLKDPLDIITLALIRKNLPVYKSTTSGAVAVGGYITVNIDGIDVNILIK